MVGLRLHVWQDRFKRHEQANCVASHHSVIPIHRAFTHRLLSSSFLGLLYRILNMNPEKELLRSLWVDRAFKYIHRSSKLLELAYVYVASF